MSANTLIGVLVMVGVLAHSQRPSEWERVEAPARESFSRVQIDTTGNVWLLGDRIHQRRPDGTWAEPVRLPGEGWTDMIVISPDLIFGVAPLGDTFDVRRAGVLTRFAEQPSCTSMKVVMMTLGRTVVAGCPYYSGLAMWRTDGSAAFVSQKVAVQDIAVIREDDVVAIGMDGVFRARRGAEEQQFLRRDDIGHSLLWADRTHIVTADPKGAFLHASWQSDTGRVGPWTAHAAPKEVSLARLWGTRANDLFAVGRAGVILHFNGKAWTAMASPVSVGLHSISGNDRMVWIAGEEGTLLRLNRR